MPDSPATQLVDRVVDGRYRVLHHLADGGMASVYVALDDRLDRRVALKVMRADLARDAAFVERFRQEARSAARLIHPHVVGVYDQGRDGDLVFLAMEYVEGTTLRERLSSGPMSPREALEILRAVLGALAGAHRAGIIHRDMKPENVLLADDGTVKVADFGLARAVSTATSSALGVSMLGTVSYLAPEQVERGVADARSDVYAVGLLLYEMLTGERAVDGDTPIQVAYRHVHGEVPAPSERVPGLPTSLDALVAHATHRDPDERPSDAEGFDREVRAAREALTDAQLDALPAPTPTPTSSEPARTDRLLRHTMPVPRATEAPTAPGEVAPKSGPSGEVGPVTAAGSAAGSTTDPPTVAEGSAPATERLDATFGGRLTGKAGDTPTTGAPNVPDLSGASGAPGRGTAPTLARRLLAGLAALLLVATGGVGWYMFIGPGSERIVPAVTGESQDTATEALTAQDLRVEVAPTFSEEIPAGRVIGSEPGAGHQVRRATVVHLAVSRGPERYAVPSVLGHPVQDATRDITDNRLTVGEMTEAFSETVSAGSVISVSPGVGSPLKPGAAVAVVVSKGRQPFPVVNWTGKPLSEAQDAVKDAGITITVLQEQHHGDVPRGAIISQTPAEGTLYRGDRITVTVSLGPEMVTVPRVQGMSEADATQALRSAGFSVDVSRIAGGLFGTAHSTDPAGGRQAPKGSTITLRVV